MRVLFVTPFFEPAWAMGGMAISPAAWALSLVNEGIEVSVFTTNANRHTDLDVPLGVPIRSGLLTVTYFPYYRWSGNGYISLSLLEACLREIPRFDCVHSVGLWSFPSFISSVIANRTPTPTLISLHGMLMKWAYGQRHHLRKAAFMKIMEVRRLAKAKALVCSSDLEKEHFESWNLPGNAVIIPNIVRPIRINTKEARQRCRMCHNLDGKFVLLFAGRLVQNKGLHLTLQAFSTIATRYPEAHLVVVGPSEDESSSLMRQQVNNRGLGDQVTFLGTLSGNDYWDALAGADLFVLNSYSENFGMAPAEALSLGVPVLLSDQVGISGLVTKYRAGVVTPLDVRTINVAMDMMLGDPAALYQMGQNGIRLVQENFAPRVVGKRFAMLLNEIVLGRPKKPS